MNASRRFHTQLRHEGRRLERARELARAPLRRRRGLAAQAESLRALARAKEDARNDAKRLVEAAIEEWGRISEPAVQH